MKLTVKNIKHLLTDDIDLTQSMDVATLDEFVSTCTSAAQEALSTSPPVGFNDFELDQLKHMIQGQRCSHLTIRSVLRDGQTPQSVDALAVARLQVETLYSVCFMLQDAGNIRFFVKNGWKKKYIRFLLHREESRHLDRFSQVLDSQVLPSLHRLQVAVGVTEQERLSIDNEQLGVSVPPGMALTKIKEFPTPMAIIEQIRNPDTKAMLARLYPEYQWLCSFAHGDSEATLFRAISDVRSQARYLLSAGRLRNSGNGTLQKMPLFTVPLVQFRQPRK